jgi:hypothetical protein
MDEIKRREKKVVPGGYLYLRLGAVNSSKMRSQN